MLTDEVEGYWNIVTTSLQDICHSNEALPFDNDFPEYSKDKIEQMSEEQLAEIEKEVNDHMSNIANGRSLVDTTQTNLQTLITLLQNKTTASEKSRINDGKYNVKGYNRRNSRGRQFYTSKYNPSEPIKVGSEVAYKLKSRHFEEWIQCEVTKVMADGTKFEIRDPEPDENNNPGQTFRASYKEVLLIPTEDQFLELLNYPYGTKVLARYPETTTFYSAVVTGMKKDGSVKLKFDGEEEVNKETEVDRSLVLPSPSASV